MMVDQVEGLITLEAVLLNTQNALTGKVMPITREGARYTDGKEQGRCADYITIAINNVWGGYDTRSGYPGSISSYECIGRHSGSVDFITGVLDSGCPVYVYRAEDDGKLHLYRLEG